MWARKDKTEMKVLLLSNDNTCIMLMDKYKGICAYKVGEVFVYSMKVCLAVNEGGFS